LELGAQALIWFGAAGGAGAFALSLLWTRFVRRDAQAVRSGGGYTLFALCMLLFAVGALVAGVASAGAGR
jgi:hypothetical protein